MAPFWLITKPILMGILCGLISVVPIGPINVTIVNEGTKIGFKAAFMIGLGSVLMELIYCIIAFTGLSTLFEGRMVRVCMEVCSLSLVTILGLGYMLAKEVSKRVLRSDLMQNRFRKRTAFMIGFSRILFNPIVLLFWITMSVTMVERDFIVDELYSKALFIAGMVCGSVGWFLFLSYEVTMLSKKFTSQTLLRISQVSGALLLLMAIVIGIDLIHEILH